jgi:hypothetical protein
MADIMLYLKTAPDEKTMMDRNRRQHKSFGWIRYGKANEGVGREG